MSPATIALISASLAEATRFAFQLADLIRRANAGEITDEQALAELRAAQTEYSSERAKWDQAGAG